VKSEKIREKSRLFPLTFFYELNVFAFVFLENFLSFVLRTLVDNGHTLGSGRALGLLSLLLLLRSAPSAARGTTSLEIVFVELGIIIASVMLVGHALNGFVVEVARKMSLDVNDEFAQE
jgi:hypothetical protein